VRSVFSSILSCSAISAWVMPIDEKTLRKHFREELSSGKFKIDMLAGKTVTELMESRDERVRLDAAKYYTARRMGWKETNFNEQGPSPSTGRANGAGLPKTRKRGKLANEPAAIW
jgi:hypothetical protein